MSADTQQNLLYTVYFIFLHNSPPIIYSLGAIVALALALYKPTRSMIIMMVGFIILLFAFEYSKHIVEPLKEQTVNSLVTMRQSIKTEYTIHVVLERLVPLGLPLLGWILVLGGGWKAIPYYLRELRHLLAKKKSV